MTEEPIVTLGEIAKFLKVRKRRASKILKRCEVPLIEVYKPNLAVFPSDLIKALKKHGIETPLESTSNGT